MSVVSISTNGEWTEISEEHDWTGLRLINVADIEKAVTENGPRVRAVYGADYYAGWVAALRWVAEKEEK